MKLYDNWREEKCSAYLYEKIAQNETIIIRKKLFTDLQHAAEKQATIWEKKLIENHLPPQMFSPPLRLRFVVLLIKIFGVSALQHLLGALKIRGMAVLSQYGHEHKHTSFSAVSNIRAAIFGINDGLISNTSLLLGMAGSGSNTTVLLIAGVAGLLAGACSMGAGEYVSVRSQREIFEYQIAIEKQELEEYPEEEIEELQLIYEARGVPSDQAQKLAEILVNNPQTGLNTLAREELGINPEDLVSPFGAMFSSFIAFALGAFIPLIPFVFNFGENNLIIGVLFAALSLFLTGTFLSLFTNKSVLFSGLRILSIGILAGGVTYMIGRLLGVAI